MSLENEHCPGCHRSCPLAYPGCHRGRAIAARWGAENDERAERVYTRHGFVDADYGQHSHGYDPEGLADPDAHNYPAGHGRGARPAVRRHNFDLDSDLDYMDDASTDAAETSSAASEPAPACPGCHVGCSLDDPQCGRGYELQKTWHEGGELPVRRRPGGPGAGGPGGPGRPGAGGPGGPGRPGPGGPMGSSAMALRFLLGLTGKILQEKVADLEAGQFLEMLRRQGHFMKFAVLDEKARMDPEKLRQILPELEAKGLVELDWDAVMLTDAGEAAAKEAEAEAQAEVEKLFAALTPEEQEQMLGFIGKLLESWREER